MVGLQAILLVWIFKNWLKFREMIIVMMKIIMTLNYAYTLSEDKIISNALIVCLFL